MCWCTCGACKGKRKREEPEERLLLQPPRPKSQKQRDAEEEFGKELKKLFERNKVSAQDSYRILEKAQKCGLEFSNPVKDSIWKTSKGSEPEKANSNAA